MDILYATIATDFVPRDQKDKIMSVKIRATCRRGSHTDMLQRSGVLDVIQMEYEGFNILPVVGV